MREMPKSEVPSFIQSFASTADKGLFPYRDLQHLKDDVEDMEVSISMLQLDPATKSEVYQLVKDAYFKYKEVYKLSVEA